jgi:hypothetical protein
MISRVTLGSVSRWLLQSQSVHCPVIEEYSGYVIEPNKVMIKTKDKTNATNKMPS